MAEQYSMLDDEDIGESTREAPTKKKERAVSDTLELITETVTGLGSVVKEYKNIANPHIDEVCDAIFCIDGVADDVASNGCMGIGSDMNMSNIFLRMNDVRKIQSKYGSGSNDHI
ncbi:hypothetical protein AMTR_s00141p00102170 [Amborella trichopoda]|uniref:Uncharacterized protein n=1 Tax=Amborella trichopoda TaxID=13333 RepID=W1PIT4_AMBTC|nr:hypothetical protein AMTR_s00141p00102170 [Amborella trichopoda]